MNGDLKRRARRADARLVIKLNRLHGNGMFHVNPDLIETVEARPDTTVTLVNKHRYVVEDTVEQVIERIVAYRALVVSVAGAEGDRAAGARIMPVLMNIDEERAA